MQLGRRTYFHCKRQNGAPISSLGTATTTHSSSAHSHVCHEASFLSRRPPATTAASGNFRRRRPYHASLETLKTLTVSLQGFSEKPTNGVHQSIECRRRSPGSLSILEFESLESGWFGIWIDPKNHSRFFGVSSNYLESSVFVNRWEKPHVVTSSNYRSK